MSALQRTSTVLARTTDVSKTFGEVKAVRAVTCAFRAGEIHAVCGENGAGKSSLLKLVAGMIEPDSGEVRVGDDVLQPHTAREAIERGVAMVLQHFALVPVFTALENIMLGAEVVSSGGVLDPAQARARAMAIARELGADLHLDEPVETLGVGDRQRIEIARALFRDAKLVILDEPTAVLTKTEAAALYRTVRRLADAGKGIVVVTHKMDEVRAHADVVTVMRRGELVFTRPLDRKGDIAAQVDAVTKAIMGAVAGAEAHAIAESKGQAVTSLGSSVLVLDDARVTRALDGISLDLRAGEIVGVAGIEGNGQSELVSVIAGDLALTGGSMKIGAGAGGARTSVAVIHEDRHAEGLVLDASLRDNVMLGELDRFASRWVGWLDTERLETEARERIERSGAPSDLERAARTLSGGNQQKIVVTRALARRSAIVVAAQPTRGVDLAASLAIHAELLAAARRGAGVLVISSDLDELRKLASRIVVLARGKIVAELPNTASDDEVGRLMLGLAHDASPTASEKNA